MSKQDWWTEEREAELRKLWPDKSLSSAAIGARLGCSKGAVNGKVHRLGLPCRTDPTKTRKPIEYASSETAPRAGAVTLPPLPSLS